MSQKIKTSVEIDGSLTANSIVKSGGTASQILAADGSVVTAGSGVTISGGTISASGSAGVLSFNTRTGAVTLTSGDVTAALGYTPYNASNPAGYISSYTETDTLQTVTDRGSVTTNPITINSTSLQHLTLNNRFNLIGSENFHISNNAYYSSGFKYKFAGNASKIALNSDNSFVFQTALTGTPDAAVTFENKFWADSAGNALSTGSMRSPIFYDYNDTSYYVDPSSTSVLSSVVLRGASAISFYGAGNGTYNIGSIYSSTSINSWEAPLETDSYTAARVPFILTWRGGYAAKGGLKLTGDASGELGGNVILHAGNYSSYAVPTSRTITINGTSYDLSANRSWTVTASETDTLQTVTSRGNVAFTPIILRTSYPYLQFEDTVTGTTKFAWQQLGVTLAGLGAGGGGYFTTYSQDKPFGWTVGGNQGVMTIDTSGNVQALSSSRAPIFYDSNNTGYYVDPASTSALNVLNMANKIILGSFPNSTTNNGDAWIGRAADRPAGTMTVQLGGNLDRKFEVVDYGWTTVNFFVNGYGVAEASGSMRAPIFYDSNNTGYYLDPTGSSYMGTVDARSFITSGNPWGTGNSAWFPNGITTPNATSWLYGTVYLGNAPGNGAGTEATASGQIISTGDHRASIFYEYSNTGYYLDPASTSNLNAVNTQGLLQVAGSTGNYNEGIRLVSGTGSWSNIQFGANMTGSGTQANQWIVGKRQDGNFVMSLAGNQDGGSRFLIQQDGRVQSPVYYDGNDTNYYLDPNGTSNLNTTVHKIIRFSGVGGDSGNGSNPDGYAIYQQGGSWDYPFPDLCIGYHTGIKIGAYYSYNGTRFYNNSDWATITASVNDGDNNFRGYYDVIAYASDKRLKHKVKPIDNALSKVKSLTGMTYQWNEVGKEHGWDPDTEVREAGVFAQDVQSVLPEAVRLAPFDDDHGVSRSGESFLTVKYDKIVPLLIEAIKEQQTQIEELKELVNQLIKK